MHEPPMAKGNAPPPYLSNIQLGMLAILLASPFAS